MVHERLDNEKLCIDGKLGAVTSSLFDGVISPLYTVSDLKGPVAPGTNKIFAVFLVVVER